MVGGPARATAQRLSRCVGGTGSGGAEGGAASAFWRRRGSPTPLIPTHKRMPAILQDSAFGKTAPSATRWALLPRAPPGAQRATPLNDIAQIVRVALACTHAGVGQLGAHAHGHVQATLNTKNKQSEVWVRACLVVLGCWLLPPRLSCASKYAENSPTCNEDGCPLLNGCSDGSSVGLQQPMARSAVVGVGFKKQGCTQGCPNRQQSSCDHSKSPPSGGGLRRAAGNPGWP